MPGTNLEGAILAYGSNVNGFGIGIGNGTVEAAGNELIGLVSNLAWIDPNFTVTPGKHHIAMTCSPTALQLYLDGVLRGSHTANAFAPTGRLRIGGYAEGVNRVLRPAGTKVDEVAVYDAILSAPTLLAHYNAGA